MKARDALIQTTRTLLSTKGYEATSPRDIQRESGVGQGSFYHHFTSKATLASEALQSLAADMCTEFDQLEKEVGLDQINAYLGLPRDGLTGCRIGRISMESSISDDRIRQPITNYFTHLRQSLTKEFAQLDTSIDPSALADLAIATVQGGFVLSRSTGDPLAMQNATTALIALVQAVAAADSRPLIPQASSQPENHQPESSQP